MRSLDQAVILCLTFWGVSILVSIMPIQIYVAINNTRLFFTLWSLLVISCLFDNTHPNRCKVTSHCDFHLHFPVK